MDIRLLDDKKFKANLISNLMIVNYEGKHEQKYSINQIIHQFQMHLPISHCIHQNIIQHQMPITFRI